VTIGDNDVNIMGGTGHSRGCLVLIGAIVSWRALIERCDDVLDQGRWMVNTWFPPKQ
jgi:hypothetical protein